jgi:ABC-type multidrug transport system permease subunit
VTEAERRRSNASLAQLRELTLMRLRTFFREPSAVFWTYGFPLLLTVALGVAFRERPPEPVDVAVVDDASEIAPGAPETIARALSASSDARATLLHRAAAERALFAGKVSVIVVPPSADGVRPRTYLYDPQRPDARLAERIADDVLQAAEGRRDAAPTRHETARAPGARYVDFLLPGLIGFNLMSSGLWGVGYVLVELRTRKQMKRFIATPMRRGLFLLSFVLMRLVFLVIELPVLLVFGALVFGVPLRGSVPLLVGVATLGSLVFAGMGLLVASRARNLATVGGLINLATLPMTIASGVFFAASRFPEAVQPIIQALPLTALIDAMRANMLEGAGLVELGRPLAILAAWGVVCFVAALRLFRWHA